VDGAGVGAGGAWISIKFFGTYPSCPDPVFPHHLIYILRIRTVKRLKKISHHSPAI